MKSRLYLLALAMGGLCLIPSCETYDDDDDDDDRRHHGSRTTVTTEETVTRPFSGSVQTETIQRY